MSENITRLLFGDDAPFYGMANTTYYDRTIKGVIVKVHYNLIDTETNPPILNQNTYRTVDIDWLEAKPYRSEYVHIPELVAFKGYGLNYLPSVGDVVLASFNSNNDPVIINIVSRCSAYQHGALNDKTGLPELNNYGDPIIDSVIPEEIRPTPIRYIEPGEISLISLNSAELYLDKYGSAKTIVRQQTSEQQMGNRLWELSIGEQIVDEGTNRPKIDNNQNIQFQLLGHQNGFTNNVMSDGSFHIINQGWDITCNTDQSFIVKNNIGDTLTINNGTINFKNSQGDSIEISNGMIKVGTNAKEPMVLGDTLTSFMNTIISIFNSHTHLYSPGPGTPTSTATPTTPMVIQDFLSKKVVVE